MEEVIIEDFDAWISQIKIEEPKFEALYDINTGAVLSVGPHHAFLDKTNKVSVEKEIALEIMEGTIKIHNCFVDMQNKTLEVVDSKIVYKIDDILHRIIDKKWSTFEEVDLYITHYKKTKRLKFELAKSLGGTKSNKNNDARRIVWSGDTVLTFFATEYNDPNIFYHSFTFPVTDLIGKAKEIKGIELPERFSVFTRRIFKNYVIEYK